MRRPDVLSHFQAELHQATGHVPQFDCNSEPSVASSLKKARFLVKPRSHSLDKATGPGDLLEALVHAMIGYINLFRKGWLHRDVSDSNVMLVDPDKFDVEQCPNGDEGHEFGLQSCRGVLIDGDRGICWKEDRTAATHRSGTLPFISIAILEAWYEGGTIHTALDDFESFLWILVWRALHFAKTHNKLSYKDNTHLESLKVTDPESLARNKKAFQLSVQVERTISFPGSFLQPFLPILVQWFDIAVTAKGEMLELQNRRRIRDDADKQGLELDDKEIEQLCLETGRKYVAAGLSALANLQGTQ
ncbi:hypothetical protein C8J57DRAFT_1188295 [Mycena rebaudengoi]|nr:hypothetical protein C8J57DRAFT_1188295 [Mycena rebaudengoi]